MDQLAGNHVVTVISYLEKLSVLGRLVFGKAHSKSSLSKYPTSANEAVTKLARVKKHPRIARGEVA